eukprot:m.142328 g.142328  ORF g.142328 m.142328 type:complete len:1079 (+) comp17135_c0_seq6:72-3308(+)
MRWRRGLLLGALLLVSVLPLLSPSNPPVERSLPLLEPEARFHAVPVRHHKLEPKAQRWLQEVAQAPPPASNHSRFVWLPSHFPASDVVTNVLHRHVLREGLWPVLPRDNVHLGWPLSADTYWSVEVHPNGRLDYDCMVSGYQRHNVWFEDGLVKEGKHFGMVTTPLQHFRFQYSQALEAGSLPQQDANIIASVFKGEEGADALLQLSSKAKQKLFNRQCYGFALKTARSVEEAAGALVSRFDRVLIAEYLDVSLVFLGDALGIKPHHLVYSLQLMAAANAKAPSLEGEAVATSQAAARLAAVVDQLSACDAALYKKANASFWEATTDAVLTRAAELAASTSRAESKCKQGPHNSARDVGWQQVPADPSSLGAIKNNTCALRQLSSPAFVTLLKGLLSYPSVTLSCSAASPQKKFVWIKTHKTGSSTLTNVFHRFVVKNKLLPVIPRDDLFLGWPNSAVLHRSFIKLPSAAKTGYDALCTAHARYNRTVMDTLVPGGKYLTILREPIAHLRSSWTYWHVGDHIKERTGAVVSLLDVIGSPDLLLGGDNILLQNSQGYDLGLARNATPADIEKLTAEMERDFAVVMITEYFDESLVLLRRRMCWEFEDIAYFSLKVQTAKQRVQRHDTGMFTASQQARINVLNYQDRALYDHFNRTLWREIAKEQSFFEEVELLRLFNGMLRRSCMGRLGLSENQHRKALVEAETGVSRLSMIEQKCSLALLDSGGFSRYLRFRSHLPVLECTDTQYFARMTYILIRPDGNIGSFVARLLYRHAILHGLRVAFPKDGVAFSTSASDLRNSVAVSAVTGFHNATNVFCCGRSTFLPKEMDKIVPRGKREGRYIFVAQDPVSTFMDAWHASGLTDLDTFLAAPERTLARLSPELQQQFQNPLARALHLDTLKEGEPARAAAETLLSTERWAAFLIAERLEESLLVLRRTMCWLPRDVMFFDELPTPSQPDGLTTAQQEAIRRFNSLDVYIYSLVVQSLEKKISLQVNLAAEVKDLRERLVQQREQCGQLIGTVNVLQDMPNMATMRPKNKERFHCMLQRMPEAMLVEWLRSFQEFGQRRSVGGGMFAPPASY